MKIKKGDTVYWCYFYAHDLHQFVIKSGIVEEIRSGAYSPKLWIYGKEDKLLCALDDAGLSSKDAISKLKCEIQDKQDEYRKDWSEETEKLRKRIDILRREWLERDSELNKKIGFLLDKEGGFK